MATRPNASASVVVAAVVAILAAVLALLGCSFALLGMLLVPLPKGVVTLPHAIRTAMVVMMAVMMAVSIFGVVTGIALIRLRNWARISVLVWGGLCVFFGAIGIPFAFWMPHFAPPSAPELPKSSQHLIMWILLLVYGLPLVTGIWWLILFNRKSVKAQFTAVGLTEAALAQKQRCPLPVTVLAWLYITSIVNLAFLPFFRPRVPVFLFGQDLSGPFGGTMLGLSFAAFFVGGVGLLKLKPWSYTLIIGLQAFWLASSTVSLLSPNYNAAMTEYLKATQAWWNLPQSEFSHDFTHTFRWIMPFALAFSVVILGMLFYYRPRFLEAASEAQRSSGKPVVP